MLTETTAELAAALTLATSRRVVEADAFMRGGQYKGFLPDLFVGKLLQVRARARGCAREMDRGLRRGPERRPRPPRGRHVMGPRAVWMPAAALAPAPTPPMLLAPAQGKTLGLVGAGRIGTAYAKMMVEGHKMNLLYQSRRPHPQVTSYFE